MTMNRDQIKYALTRLKTIYDQKHQDIVELTYIHPVELSYNEKLDALRTGKFTIKDSPTGYSYGNGWWYQAVQFEGEIKSDYDKEKRSKLEKALSLEYNTLRDKFMLDDVQEALNALNNFSNFKIE